MSARIRVILVSTSLNIILTLLWVIVRGLTMEYSELFVKRIRLLCKERNFSINYLASISDVKQSTLDNIMRGLTKNPRIKTLHKIALACNMTLSEFLNFEELNTFTFDDDSDEE